MHDYAMINLCTKLCNKLKKLVRLRLNLKDGKLSHILNLTERLKFSRDN